MNITYCLCVDDDRVNRHPPRDGNIWVRAYNFHEAIVLLNRRDYAIVSLDHDIASFYGNKEMTGRDILNYMIAERVENGRFMDVEVRVHSANPVGRATMEQDIARWFPVNA